MTGTRNDFFIENLRGSFGSVTLSFTGRFHRRRPGKQGNGACPSHLSPKTVPMKAASIQTTNVITLPQGQPRRMLFGIA
jgi:hypothetical protein